ncbi:cytidine deaminase [Streptomyces sp. NPDC006332]|uniref:cytidine deaminase n=1 Tax=Streptomyces sp. NPDC006332 TaxID=3155456 RepID=UPI0033BAAC81
MKLDQALVDAAMELMDRRWPAGEPGGAAAVRLADGGIFTSVGLDNMHGSVALCQETGAFIQAYTQDRAVTASVCVSRDLERGRILILPPCGVCQERLALWGPSVEVAVPQEDDPTRWEGRTLAEVNPYYWGSQFTDGRWPSQAEHAE